MSLIHTRGCVHSSDVAPIDRNRPAETLYWPTAESFALESEFQGQTPKGYFYAANRYRASEHGGTHIDAPIHFAKGHKSLDQIPSASSRRRLQHHLRRS
jgi:hypothetical protein